MATLANRVKMSTATTGTGTLTLGTASASFQSFADGGISDTNVVKYLIEDGVDWEIGTGTYTSSGTTLSRTVIESTNSDAALNLTGNALVSVQVVATDLQGLVDFGATFSLPTSDGTADQILKTDGSGNLGFATAGGGGGLVPISKTTASNDSAVDIDLTGGYSAYLIQFSSRSSSGTRIMHMRTSTDGGTTFDTGASDYGWVYHRLSPTASNASDGSDDRIDLGSAMVADGTNDIANFEVWVFPRTDSRYTSILSRMAATESGTTCYWSNGSGVRYSTSTVDAVRFFQNLGNIYGDFHLFGRVDGDA